MSERAQVEVVMECNIRARARVDHPVWAPSATSTPVRKPLFMLNNAEITGSRKCDGMKSKVARKVLAIEGSEGKRALENVSKNTVKKKWNKTSRKLHYLDDEDDDSDDEKEEDKSKKQLIIKSGSSQISKRITKKKNVLPGIGTRSNEQQKYGIQCNFFKFAKSGDNETDDNDVKYERMPLGEKHEHAKDVEVNEANLYESDFNTSETVGSGHFAIKLSDIQKPLTTSNDINLINDCVQQKRKNKSMKTNVKRLKSESNSVLFSQSTENNNQEKLKKSNSKSLVKSRNILNPVKQESITGLSVSHVIFSDNREKEFRDSLNMTSVDSEELSGRNPTEGDLHTKQKDLSQQKIKLPKKKEICEASQSTRPKRERKSPKEFWLPKTENSSRVIYSNCDTNDIVTSTETCIEQDKSILVSASKKSEDMDPPLKTAHVKPVSEMEFEENGAKDERKRYSVALGWQCSIFKCCFLKIGPKSEASGRTKSNKSHFGGVLLKGRLTMNIGETEVKMKDGDMFHIPPLTDWKAVNTGRIDCILYYWVGKF